MADRLYDVVVIGAGPSGTTAARNLAKKGIKVAILDKTKFPRKKVCGGGLVYRALALVPRTALHAVERFCYNVLLSFVKSHLTFQIWREYPIISMVSRKRFDVALLEMAINAGCSFVAGAEVKNVTKVNGLFHIECGKGSFRAPFLIAADGATSRTSHLLGVPDERVLIPAVEARIDVRKPEAIGEQARFDFDIFHGGYGWVFPKSGHYSVGVLTCHRKSSILSALKSYAAYLGFDWKRVRSVQGAFIPIRPRKKYCCHDGLFFVGDSLGWVDPIVAEGLTGALMSGELVARAISKADLVKDKAEKLYRQALERMLWKDYPWSAFLAKIVYKRPRLRDLCFRLYGQEIADAVTDIMSGKWSHKWLILWPFNYLKAIGLLPCRIKHLRITRCCLVL